MEKFKIFIAFSLLAITLSSFVLIAPMANKSTEGEVTWMNWEEATEAQKKEPKKILVDVYTGWCGWCKQMDRTTFKDANVVQYLNENFYAVKLDAEQKADINYAGNVFKFMPDAGRRGVHTLAYSILDGRMSYPSVVYFDEKVERIMISPGYKNAKALMKELTFAAEEHYKTTSWKDYSYK